MDFVPTFITVFLTTCTLSFTITEDVIFVQPFLVSCVILNDTSQTPTSTLFQSLQYYLRMTGPLTGGPVLFLTDPQTFGL